MEREVSLTAEERLHQLLRHLGIARAHFAAHHDVRAYLRELVHRLLGIDRNQFVLVAALEIERDMFMFARHDADLSLS